MTLKLSPPLRRDLAFPFFLIVALLSTTCAGGGSFPVPPDAPSGIAVVVVPGQASISWEPIPDANFYSVYYSTTGGVTKATGTKVISTASPKAVTGLNNGTTYFFIVTAVKDDIESVESSEVTATPPIQYVAIGDSITYGTSDDILTDGIGYEPILGDLLTASKGIPHSITNEGVPGIISYGGSVFLTGTLAKYPSANYYLVMYGTNDAAFPGVPSGMGLNAGDAGYAGSFKNNMQRIISAIRAAGKKPFLAKIPYCMLTTVVNDQKIQEYNVVIDELVAGNGIPVTPPDFYDWFKTHPDEMPDLIHPNGSGYRSMANMWFNALP